ncbi:MAG: hypothetical protein ACD_45C00631G0003 [uncultured bacterium]|nr:MAG: hypothetical protein ACD_45C00631G0003 [uncultured bacterium]
MSDPRSTAQRSTAQESKEFDFEKLAGQIASQEKVVNDIEKLLKIAQEKLRNLQYTLNQALITKEEAERNAPHPNDAHKDLLEKFFKASDTYWDLYYKTDPDIQRENQQILQSPGYREDAGYQSSRPSLIRYQGKEKFNDLFKIVLGKEVMSGARYGDFYDSLCEKTVNKEGYQFIKENYNDQQKIYQKLIQWADQPFSQDQANAIQDKIKFYNQETMQMQRQQELQLRSQVRRK